MKKGPRSLSLFQPLEDDRVEYDHSRARNEEGEQRRPNVEVRIGESALL